ncbi:MAG TPA: hypothetical protein VFQ78_07055 [Candidatus Udaeobacter sp.]|nr:hypothetical protein [Candidatus Udaeobacter sp.]
MCHQIRLNIAWKLARSFFLPGRQNTFGIQGGELLLDPVFELKIQGRFLVAVLVSQNRYCLALVMVTVVKKEYDFPASILLETSRRQNLGDQISLRKKSARLLAETDDRVIHR